MAEETKNQSTEEAAPQTNAAQTKQDEGKQDRTFTRDDLNKMIAAEKKKAKDEALAEYQRLAKMTEAERAKEKMTQKLKERDEERKAFEAEKKAFERDKMQMQTEKELVKRSLPAEFASFLVTDNADTTKNNLDSFEKLFRSSVEASVTERIRGKNPPTTPTTKLDTKSSVFGNGKAWNKNK